MAKLKVPESCPYCGKVMIFKRRLKYMDEYICPDSDCYKKSLSTLLKPRKEE